VPYSINDHAGKQILSAAATSVIDSTEYSKRGQIL